MWFSFFFFFPHWALREHSESIQTAFRASHGKAHGLGNFNCAVLCEEIILLCSFILPFASVIQCPLSKGSTQPFLIYLFHSSPLQKLLPTICLSGWGVLVKSFSRQRVISKPPLATGRQRYEIALWSGNRDLERNRFAFSFFPPKEFSVSPIQSLFGGQMIDHHARNDNYLLTFEINLELTQINSEGWVRNGQRSVRIFHVNCTWTCSLQNHFSCSLWLFFVCFIFKNYNVRLHNHKGHKTVSNLWKTEWAVWYYGQ